MVARCDCLGLLAGLALVFAGTAHLRCVYLAKAHAAAACQIAPKVAIAPDVVAVIMRRVGAWDSLVNWHRGEQDGKNQRHGPVIINSRAGVTFPLIR